MKGIAYLLLGLFLFTCTRSSFAESKKHRSGKRKVLVGAILLGAGAALGIYGGKNVFDDEEPTLFVIGVGLAGFGPGAII